MEKLNTRFDGSFMQLKHRGSVYDITLDTKENLVVRWDNHLMSGYMDWMLYCHNGHLGRPRRLKRLLATYKFSKLKREIT